MKFWIIATFVIIVAIFGNIAVIYACIHTYGWIYTIMYLIMGTIAVLAQWWVVNRG